MIKVVLLIVVFIFVILGIGAYLGPDDLKGCQTRPSAGDYCQPADAIVAVSGGDTAARTYEAIRLYQNGWAPRLVFSGAAQDKSGPSNAAVMRSIAHAEGVPEDDIVIDEYSRTTRQNAEETAFLLRRDNVSSVILVTSAYHQRRTSLEFGERFDGIHIRNHPVGQDKQWSMWWWLTPAGWYLALSELAKIALFYIGGTR